jgi:ABC-type phosphate transport system substrate-binding protein
VYPKNSSRWIVGLAVTLASMTAMADVVAVVSSKSPTTTLSKAQIADIFFGKVRRFPDGEPAKPLDQAEGSGARNEFYQRIAGQSAAQMKAYWSKLIFTGRGQPPPTVSNSVEMKKWIAENPTAIGYIDRSLIDESVKVVF